MREHAEAEHADGITFRATFPTGSDGTQYVQVEQFAGAAATDRTASGTIIIPPNAPVGEVVECSNGIKLFAGPRLDPFRNFIPYRSWALSNSEHCPVGGPERSWVTWSGGVAREAVTVFRHGRGCRWAWRDPPSLALVRHGALRG